MRGQGLTAACMLALGIAALASLAAPAPAAGDSHPAPPPGAVPGMIAVADSGNNRIQVFHPDGTFAAFMFGGAPGHLFDIGPTGRVVIGQAVYDPNGTLAFMLESGSALGEVNDLYAVAVGPDERIVVADHVGNVGPRIQVFNSDGSFALAFGSRTGEDRLGSVRDIAVGPRGLIAVADGDVRFFNSDGSPVPGLSIPHWGYAWSRIAFGPDGQIATASQYGYGLGVFHQVRSPNGTVSFEGDRWAYGNGSQADFDRQRGWGGVDVSFGPDGRLVVADGSGNRVQVYHPVNATRSFVPVDLFVRHPNGTFAHHPNGTFVSTDMFVRQPNGTFVWMRVFLHPDGTAFHPDGSHAHPSTGSLIPVDRFVRQPNGTFAHHPNGTFVSRGWLVQLPNGSLVPSGSLAFEFGSFGSVSREFDSPTDVAVGPDGRIAVAEPGNYIVRVFHPNGSAALEFGSRGHGDGHFNTPRHVAVGPDGRIVVGDTGKQRVQVFNADGSPELAFGSAGDGEGMFRGLSDVAVGPDGRIAVADVNNGRVQVFHPNGSFALTVVEGAGLGAMYWQESATHVAAGPNGRIVVGDNGFYAGYSYRGKSVRVFDTNVVHPNGSVSPVLHAFTIQGIGGALAVGPDGRIVVSGEDGIEVFRPDGSFAFASGNASVPRADAVAVGPDGRIAMVDSEGNRVQVFNADGSHAFAVRPDLAEGKFDGPNGVAVGPLILPVADAAPADLPVILGPSAGGLRNFTSAGDAANLAINVTELAEPGGPPLDGSESSTVVFPPAETVVAASFAEVSFPPSVTASHVPADGVLALRVAAAGDAPTAEQVQDALGRNGTEIVLLQRVVEVGAEDSRVVFDLPIRILLEGQAGGRAFWVEGGGGAGGNGTITPIDVQCDAVDDTAAVHDQLGGSGECQIDEPDGGAKIVYTYHLTQFGTVASGGPAPQPVPAGAGNGTGPAPPAPPVVAPPPSPGNGTGAGNGTGPAPPPTPAPPPVLPTVVPPAPVPPVAPAPPPATCSMVVASPDLGVSARPGGYSQPVGQTLINSGSLPFARVEIGATPWSVDSAGGAPSAPPAPAAPPPEPPSPALGPNEGRLSGILTAVLVAALPAGATEVSEQGGAAGGWEPVVNGTTAVAAGLEGGDEAPLWFRLNLTPYEDLQAGTTLVQSVTYQAECALPP